MDPYSGDQQSPLSFHKYAYVHMNPVAGIDPTGMFGMSVMSMLSLCFGLLAISTLSYIAISPSAWQTFSDTINIMATAIAGGFDDIITIGIERLNKAVKEAIDSLADTFRIPWNIFRQGKIFPVLEDRTRSVYFHHLKAMSMGYPFVLTYDSEGAGERRKELSPHVKSMRLMASPWEDVDEYPYASTIEGGFSLLQGKASLELVYLRDNRSHGGMLTAFYYGMRQGEKFTVLPIPRMK